MTTPRLLLAALLAAFFTGAISTSAGASAPAPRLYWAGYDNGTVGRANLNGSSANPNFITGGSTPCGDVAVTRSYVYWSNSGSSNSIGRAKLDGTGVDQSFITGAGAPCGVAVYAGHLYWANYSSHSIGRADLDGTNVNQTFIPGAGLNPCGIAAGNGHLYWGVYGYKNIGRANIDGSGANSAWVGTAGNACYGIAVDAHHVYWADYENNRINRVDLHGSNRKIPFITGGNGACGVAVTATSIFWSNYDTGTIGRAKLDGTGVNQSFITNAPGNCGLGVGAPSTKTQLRGSPRQVHPHVRVTYTATVTPLPDGGTVSFTANGKGIRGCATRPVSIVTGKAMCSTRFKKKGKWSIRGSYSGDDSFLGSSSSAVKQVVK